MNAATHTIYTINNIESAQYALCDLPQEGLWAALRAHQTALAQLEMDTGSDAPSAGVLDALLGSLHRTVSALGGRHARA